MWDPVKKKWVNADGTENEAASAAPPPKDADLMAGGPPGGASGGPPTGAGLGGPPPPAGNGGPNRFSLKAKGKFTISEYFSWFNTEKINSFIFTIA